MKLSKATEKIWEGLARKWQEKGSGDNFHIVPEHPSESLNYKELAHVGFIKMWGLKGGGWVVTPAGISDFWRRASLRESSIDPE